MNLLSEDRDDRLGLGVRAYLDIPTEKPAYNDTRSCARTRRPECRERPTSALDLSGGQSDSRSPSSLVNVGYKQVGDPDRGLRVQFVDSSRTDAGFLVGPPQEIEAGSPRPARGRCRRGVPGVRDQAAAGMAAGRVRLHALHRLWHSDRAAGRIPPRCASASRSTVPGYKAAGFRSGVSAAAEQCRRRTTLRTTFLVTPDGKGDINFSENVDPQVSAEVEALSGSQGRDVFTRAAPRSSPPTIRPSTCGGTSCRRRSGSSRRAMGISWRSSPGGPTDGRACAA